MNKNTKSVAVRGRGRPAKYKFSTLRIGGALTAPLAARNTFVTSAYLWAKRHGVKFATKKIAGGRVEVRRVRLA